VRSIFERFPEEEDPSHGNRKGREKIMPGYKGHVTGGVILWGGAFAGAVALGWVRYEPVTALVLGIVALMGALFPDTDTDSKGQNVFYAGFVVLDLAFMIKGMFRWAALLGFCALLPALGRHRGWTHTWWAMLLVPLPILLIPAVFFDLPLLQPLPFYLSAVAGYFSHLLLDRIF
jgi:membrane-bound metal-dependent hydrolase YbcI (DUF457 family)